MRNLKFAAAAVAVSFAASSAPALADDASSYNLFVLGNMTSQNSSVQGRVAVGGNASLQNYAVAGGAASGQPNLVVGGNVTTQSGSVNGGVVAGGTSSFTWTSYGSAQSGATPPVDFAAEALRLKTLTTSLAAYDANGTTSSTFGGWRYTTTFTGTNADLNVFNIDAAMLANSNDIKINIAAGSHALINVTGANASMWTAGFTLNGGDASSILWNFAQATNLSFYNIGVMGSVLAPNAAYDPAGWGSVNGQMIVGSFLGDGGGVTSLTNVSYSGDLLRPVVVVAAPPPGGGEDGGLTSAAPEPSTWAMMIIGFAGLGLALRRRRLGVANLA